MDAILNVQGFNPQYKNYKYCLSYRYAYGRNPALKWEDVNFTQGFLMVRRTVSYYEKSTKRDLLES